MATLYELKQDLQYVLDGGLIVDEETGEVLFDSSNLEKLQAEYEAKLEACGLYIKNLESDAKEIRAEEIKLAARRRVLENKAKRLRTYLLVNLGDNQQIKTPRLSMSIRRSDVLEIDDDAELADEWYRIKREPNKAAIKEALKAGAEIDGVRIISNRSLQLK